MNATSPRWIGIILHLSHLREGPRRFVSLPLNTTVTPFMEGKSVRAHYTRRKSAIDASSMKGKSADLPKEGKKAKKTSVSI